jgi:CheY-like chemotaxis protein
MALKIVADEYAHELVSIVSGALRTEQRSHATGSEMPPFEANERAKILAAHIDMVTKTERAMHDLQVLQSGSAKELMLQAEKSIDKIRTSFISTGLSMSDREDTARQPEILFEAVTATREIQWRLRDIARDLALHSVDLPLAEAEAFHPLIAMLDAEPHAKPLPVDAKSKPNRQTETPQTHKKEDPKPETHGLADLPTRTLLLVDDEPSVLAALARTLRPQGYRILKAHDGFHALDLLLINEIGVVLSDHRMPGMTGVELLSRVKTMYPRTIRIILSGYADVKTVTDAIRLGAVYKFMTKPWEQDELTAVLDQAFEKYEG